MRRRAFLAGAAALGAAGSRRARADGAAPFQALSGDRFHRGDTEYRLADVLAPPLYVLGDAPPVHFDASKRALQRLLNAGAPTLAAVGAPDRWGVAGVIVSTFTGDAKGEDVAALLAAGGAVRVAPQTDDLARIDRLLAAERAARCDRRGLWAHDAYRLRRAGDLEDAAAGVGGFHVLEGAVLSTGAGGGRVYLNFGDDYRTDFTASAATRLARRWKAAGLDLAALGGARVRVRGYVEAINGPSVDLAHVRQIEILGTDAAAGASPDRRDDPSGR